jgi:hypothetical protein
LRPSLTCLPRRLKWIQAIPVGLSLGWSFLQDPVVRLVAYIFAKMHSVFQVQDFHDFSSIHLTYQNLQELLNMQGIMRVSASQSTPATKTFQPSLIYQPTFRPGSPSVCCQE